MTRVMHTLRSARCPLRVELLEDRSVPAAGLAALAGGEVRPVMVAYDAAALAASAVSPDSPYDGVARLTVLTVNGLRYRGSGALLADSNPSADYLLTAAHMVVDDYGRMVTSVAVEWPGGATATAEAIYVHPGWTNDPLQGNDLAVVRVAQLAPDAAPDRYELFRERTTSTTRLAQPEVPEVLTRAGYGLPGTGGTGYTNDPTLFGTLRVGQNRYDDTYTPTTNRNWSTHTMLAYDFDSGRSRNDSIGFWFGIRDLGLGTKEAFAAPGDSGGPSFIGGKIAGVTSFIQSLPYTDARYGANSSFGEIGYDTRVALFAAWIDGVMAPTAPAPVGTAVMRVVPTPGVLKVALAEAPDAPAVWMGVDAAPVRAFADQAEARDRASPVAPAARPAEPTAPVTSAGPRVEGWAAAWAGPAAEHDPLAEGLGGIAVG